MRSMQWHLGKLGTISAFAFKTQGNQEKTCIEVHGTATRNIQIYDKQNIGKLLSLSSDGTHCTSQASYSDERLLSRAVICDGMDFSERKNFVREFVSVGNENHFLCPEVDSGVETIREGKDIYLQLAEGKSMLYKPLLGPVGVEVITERVPGSGTVGTLHRNQTPRHSCSTNRRKKYDSYKHPR